MSYLLKQAGPYTLTKTWYVDGTAADVGTVTIGITDANGDTVVAAGTSTTNNGDGTYTYQLADQSQCDVLNITWTRSDTSADLIDRIEVIGSVLFTEYALRNFDDSAVSSGTDYTDADLADVHTRVVDSLEHWTGRSWVQRYARVEIPGSGDHDLWLDDAIYRTSTGIPLHRPGGRRDIIRVLSCTVDGTSVSTGNIRALPDGRFVRTDNTWTKPTRTNPYNVMVEYEYGQSYPVDGSDRIGMMIARHMLVASRIPDNAVAFTDQLGSYTFDQTRLPFEAYQWIKSHRIHAPFAL